LRVVRTGEWSEVRSKQDLGKAESWGMPLVTEVQEIKEFVAIGRPVGGFSSGEVVEI
jgi:hypothetical protein